MCYKPRFTRHIKLAEHYGWQTVDGVNIIAYQIEEQWMLWAGEQNADKIPVEAARAVLYRAALG
jgi:quinate dehydrogenase